MAILKDKVAVITGGGGGIGRAIAEIFSQEGAKIVIADWNDELNQETVNALRKSGTEASSVKTDVSQPDQVREMIHHALGAHGRLDILVNNAGKGSVPTPIHAIELNDWDQVVNICLKGVFLGMKYAIPQMMEQGSGNIINIASIAGILGSNGLAPYAAAKAGVIELTKTAAVEYSRYNIRCNAIAPGWTETNMVAGYIGGSAETEARMKKGIPMRRFGKVSEIAQTALFLANDAAGFVQGQTIVVDGGITIL